MALDTGIYNVLAQPRKSAFEYKADFERQDRDREQAGQQRQLNALAMQQRQGQISDESMTRADAMGVRNVLASGGGAAELRRLGSVGAFEQADALDRRAAEAQRAQTGADAQKQEAMHQRLKVYREALGGGMVTDPQAAAQWLRAQYEDPATSEYMLRLAGPFDAAAKRIPTDPAGFARWQQQSVIGMDKFIQSTAPKPQQVRVGDRVAIVDMNPNSPTYGTEQQSIDVNATPGQQMLHERAVAKAQGRGAAPVGRSSGGASSGGKAPSGYRWAAGGALEAIPGGPADKGASAGKPPAALTEGQSNALMFGARMGAANEEIDQLAAKGTNMPSVLKQSAENIPLVGRMAGAAVNSTQTPAQQQVEQAKRDFINALLRKESGAAIGQDEFKNADRQYFPQVGDSPAVIAQKRRNRELAQQTMMMAVPEHARTLPPKGPAGQQPAAKPATKAPTVSNW